MDKLKILLVEDHDISRKVALYMLERSGNLVDCVATGEEAISKYKNDDYDVVLIDIGLPDMSGIDIVKVIRKHEDAKSKQALLISLTAHSNASYEANALAAGYDFFIEKPLSLNKISNIISEFYLKKKNDAPSCGKMPELKSY